MSSFPCVSPNPDITGIGVRTAIYVQAVLTLVQPIIAQLDGVIDMDEVRDMSHAFLGVLLPGCALIIAAMIQVRTLGLSVYHGLIVLNLSWINNISVLVFFISAVLAASGEKLEDQMIKEIKPRVHAVLTSIESMLQRSDWKPTNSSLLRMKKDLGGLNKVVRIAELNKEVRDRENKEARSKVVRFISSRIPRRTIIDFRKLEVLLEKTSSDLVAWVDSVTRNTGNGTIIRNTEDTGKSENKATKPTKGSTENTGSGETIVGIDEESRSKLQNILQSLRKDWQIELDKEGTPDLDSDHYDEAHTALAVLKIALKDQFYLAPDKLGNNVLYHSLMMGYLASIHFTLFVSLGLWIWFTLHTFGNSPSCTPLTSITLMFGTATRVTEPSLRIASIVVYTLGIIPLINVLFMVMLLATPLIIAAALFLRNETNIDDPEWNRFLIKAGASVTFMVQVYLIICTELTIRNNQHLQAGGGSSDNQWTFGQTLALMLLVIPLLDFYKSIRNAIQERRKLDEEKKGNGDLEK